MADFASQPCSPVVESPLGHLELRTLPRVKHEGNLTPSPKLLLPQLSGNSLPPSLKPTLSPSCGGGFCCRTYQSGGSHFYSPDHSLPRHVLAVPPLNMRKLSPLISGFGSKLILVASLSPCLLHVAQSSPGSSCDDWEPCTIQNGCLSYWDWQ